MTAGAGRSGTAAARARGDQGLVPADRRRAAPSFRTIALDLPGFGDSYKPLSAPYHPPFFARAVVDAAGRARARARAPHRQQHGRARRARARPAPPGAGRAPGAARALARLAPRATVGAAACALLRPGARPRAGRPALGGRGVVHRILPVATSNWVRAGVDEFLRAYLTPRGRVAFYAAARQIYLEEPHGAKGFWTRLRGICSRRRCSSGASAIGWCRSASRAHVREALPSARHLELDCGHVPQIERPARDARRRSPRFCAPGASDDRDGAARVRARPRPTGALGLSWLRRDTCYPSPVPDNAKFMSPRDAVRLIRDGDVVATSGLGAQSARLDPLLRHSRGFEATGHPRRAHGREPRRPRRPRHRARHAGGARPGRGLCTRLITGHFETFRAMLDLAAAGQCELQCIPLGNAGAAARRRWGAARQSLLSETGVGTFIDPRVGPGSPVCGTAAARRWSRVERDRLRYRMPPIDVAIFNVPAADRRGNLYVKNCAIDRREPRDRARRQAQRRPRHRQRRPASSTKATTAIFLPAEMVDAVVYHPDTEQTAGMFHREHWPALTTESDVSIDDALARVRFVNWLAGVTPRRTAADEAVARLAAATLLANVPPRRHASTSASGFPKRWHGCIFEAGRLDDVTLRASRAACSAGCPRPGIYFGAAFSRSASSPRRRCSGSATSGSTRPASAPSRSTARATSTSPSAATAPRDYVGPGGFIDLTTAATHHRLRLGVDGARRDRASRTTRCASPSAARRSSSIASTRSPSTGRAPLAAGKRVFYATPVGLFRLTRRGVELVGRDARHRRAARHPRRHVDEDRAAPLRSRSPAVADVVHHGRLGEARARCPEQTIAEGGDAGGAAAARTRSLCRAIRPPLAALLKPLAVGPFDSRHGDAQHRRAAGRAAIHSSDSRRWESVSGRLSQREESAGQSARQPGRRRGWSTDCFLMRPVNRRSKEEA